MQLAVVLGTRPEIIKFSPLIRILEKSNEPWRLIHTNQHYSYELDRVFFQELGLPDPHYNLEVGSGSHGKQTGLMLAKLEEIYQKEGPTLALVQGDTNTVLAGSISAAKLHIPVGHVEAGLRSYDERMPEELNRRLCDHISHFLFAPTEISRKNLLNEGIDERRIYVTGNTIVDALKKNLSLAREKEKEKDNILEKLDLDPKDFFLVTIHRQENVDDPEQLGNIIKGLLKLSEEYDQPIIYPIHPRTKKMLEKFKLDKKAASISNLRLIEPLSYFQFLVLEAEAQAILTDSGGVQEESCILGTPCITLRENTERPETINVGSNTLVGTDPERLITGVNNAIIQKKQWSNPFGKGDSAQKILKILSSNLN